MQQAIYNNINGTNIHSSALHAAAPVSAAGQATGTTRLLRRIGRKWDLVGVVALMGSSAAYGVFALLHLA